MLLPQSGHSGCEHTVEAGRRASPPVAVWRGDQSLPTSEQGIRVLGTPFGHSDHVTAPKLSEQDLGSARFAVP